MTTTRDQQASAEHFTQSVSNLENSAISKVELLAQAVEMDFVYGASHVDGSLASFASAVMARYSMGTDIAELKTYVSQLGEHWTRIFAALGDKVDDAAWKDQLATVQSDKTLLATAMNSLVWAYSFGDRATAKAVHAPSVVADHVTPELAIVAKFAGVECSAVEASKTQVYPGFVELAAAEESERSALLTRYVAGWLKQWKKVKLVTPSTDSWYMGHWCLEVVPLVVEYNIDDSAARKHAWYPADLVDYVRANQ